MIKKIMPLLAAIGLAACNNNETTTINQPKDTMTRTEYKKADWIHTTNVYEVNLRQYTKEGTFNAFAKELPRLKEMGVETLWFMPITPIAQKKMKGTMGSYYACSDYTAINPEFGNLEDFKNLVKTAHSMGFKVIIDWVANHTGWDHVWTKTHPEYFEKDSATNDFKVASGMDDIIELDYKNPALRKAMIDAMRYWVTECDIDGYRCDLAFWVELDFWLEARTELEKTKTLFWLAESDPLEHPDYFKAFDACYTWTWMHKTEDFYKKHPDKHILDTVLKQYDSVCSSTGGIPLWFTTNHDENSWNGSEYEKYGDMAKALAVFSFTWNGMPMIYSGQELPNMKRLKFFDKDTIEWNGKYELHDFYKTLLTLKTNNHALRAADSAVSTYLLLTTDKNVLAYLRKNESDEIVVLINLSKEKINFDINDKQFTGRFAEVFSKQQMSLNEIEHIELKPWGYKVFQKLKPID